MIFFVYLQKNKQHSLLRISLVERKNTKINAHAAI